MPNCAPRASAVLCNAIGKRTDGMPRKYFHGKCCSDSFLCFLLACCVESVSSGMGLLRRGTTKLSKDDREGRSDGTMGITCPPAAGLKAILFDVDGTITDSDPLHFQAFKEIFQQARAEWGQAGFDGGEPMSREYFLKQISGKLNTVITAEQFPDLDEHARTKITEDKEARFRSLAKEHTTEIAGLSRFVEWIKQRGLRRAAVSNSPRENVEQVISALGFNEFFELVVIGNECERPKPFPDPYLKALQFFGVSPQEALVFEDSPAGTRAGAAAEVAVVGLTTGHPKAALLAAGATLIIQDYNDPELWAKLQPDVSNSEQEVQKRKPDDIDQEPPTFSLELNESDEGAQPLPAQVNDSEQDAQELTADVRGPKQEVQAIPPNAEQERRLQSSTT